MVSSSDEADNKVIQELIEDLEQRVARFKNMIEHLEHLITESRAALII